MKNLLLILSFLLTIGTAVNTNAASGFGFQVGLGLPFLSQSGVYYYFNDQFGVDVSTNSLDIDLGTASIGLSMPQLLVNYHPFSGSFFVALGMGQLTSTISATDSTTGLKATAEIVANTTIGKMGWTWGIADGGLWLGIDYSMIMPSSPKTTITANGVPTNTTAYTDLVDASNKYGETSLGNITYLRIGYLF